MDALPIRLLAGLIRWSTLRLLVWPAAIGAVIGVLVFVARLDHPIGPGGVQQGGDFLAFYAAGRMVLNGQGNELYDLAAQKRIQAEIVGDESWNGVAAFVNPPSVALVCTPLAALPYRWAYAVSIAFLLAAFLIGCWFLRDTLQTIAPGNAATVVALLALWMPFGRTITGGQNTAVTFALLAGVYAGLRHRRLTLSGVCLGLLFYKPQMAVLLAGLLAWRGEWRPVAVSAAIGIAHGLAGAVLVGWAWPADFVAHLHTFWPLEFRYNGAHLISWMGVAEYSAPPDMFWSLGAGLCVLTAAVVAVVWAGAVPGGRGVELPFAAAVCGTVLISPHTQWYDAGLVALPVLLVARVLVERHERVAEPARALLALGYLAFPVYLLGSSCGWQPLVAWPLVGLWWVVRTAAPPALTADAQTPSTN